ncbi:hypothetical protein VTP01DRAFT_2294 [Rhizomucor pusillus]|uniref:uncharacterized protein n=1 Tax=Rhizomucor pusillus TaxID=4840 RepID=UPI003742D47E
MDITYTGIERLCVNGKCHCDWRLTIHDCEEADYLYYIFVINIALSAVVSIMGFSLLFYRMVIKGHSLLERRSAQRGCLRPKPIECMVLSLSLYNLMRLVSSVILVGDLVHDNLAARSFLFEFPWQFGYGAFALYLVGIAQTLAESHKAISTGWLPSPRVVDVIGGAIFFTPFTLNNAIAVTEGAISDRYPYVAQVLVRTHYSVWTFHCLSLTTALLFSGIRLVNILNVHLTKMQPGGARYLAIKTGIFKIRAVMLLIAGILLGFAAQCILYSALRDRILTSTAGSVTLSAFWTYLGPLGCFCLNASIILNPSQRPNFFGSKSSSQEKSSSQTYGTEYVSTMTNEHTSLSRSAFEDFKQHQRAVEQGSYVSAGAGMPTTVNAMSPVASSIPLEYMEPSYRPTSQGRHRQHLEDDEEEMLHEQKPFPTLSRAALRNYQYNNS